MFICQAENIAMFLLRANTFSSSWTPVPLAILLWGGHFGTNARTARTYRQLLKFPLTINEIEGESWLGCPVDLFGVSNIDPFPFVPSSNHRSIMQGKDNIFYIFKEKSRIFCTHRKRASEVDGSKKKKTKYFSVRYAVVLSDSSSIKFRCYWHIRVQFLNIFFRIYILIPMSYAFSQDFYIFINKHYRGLFFSFVLFTHVKKLAENEEVFKE